MTTTARKSVLVAALFSVSAYCACGILAVAQMAPSPVPRSTFVTFYMFVAGFAVFLAIGVWQLVVLLRKHGSENQS